jgi:hypothetical protein
VHIVVRRIDNPTICGSVVVPIGCRTAAVQAGQLLCTLGTTTNLYTCRPLIGAGSVRGRRGPSLPAPEGPAKHLPAERLDAGGEVAVSPSESGRPLHDCWLGDEDRLAVDDVDAADGCAVPCSLGERGKDQVGVFVVQSGDLVT